MNLNIINLLSQDNPDMPLFMDKVDSKLMMDISKNEILENDDWIDEVIFTVPYLEKALRNPNKQIITEEEVVKIELIKKVSVESIKHLSKNTNLISEFDEKTQDVKPSKILNAYKEESFLTYENRFLYTLIKLIDDFIYLRTKGDEDKNAYKGKHHQKANYEATTKVRKEKIKLTFEYVSQSAEESKKSGSTKDKMIELQKNMRTLKATNIYQLLEEKRATPIKAPLKMTNVLLKNTNFQYAVKLWNYLSDNMDIKNKAVKSQKKYEEKGKIKELVDEDFFIKYLIFNSLNKQVRDKRKRQISVEEDKKERKELTEKLMEQIIDINPDLVEQELKKMITDKYIVYKRKKEVSLKPLEESFKKGINKYLDRIEKLRLK